MVFMKREDEREEEKRRAARLQSDPQDWFTVLNSITWDGVVLDKGEFGFVNIRLVQPRDSTAPTPHEEFPLPLIKPDTPNSVSSTIPAKLVDRDPLSETVVKLGEEFYFEINSPISGYTLALQRITTQWEPLALNAGMPIAQISEGSNFAPFNDAGHIEALIEREQARRHKFVFVISTDPVLHRFTHQVAGKWQIADQLMDDFAQAVSKIETPWHILRLDVMFSA